MIEVGDRVLITSPRGRKIRCWAMVMEVGKDRTVFLDRKLPNVKPGDMMYLEEAARKALPRNGDRGSAWIEEHEVKES